MTATRRGLKNVLARTPDRETARGATVLIYHRVGGGSGDELDVSVTEFERQVDELEDHRSCRSTRRSTDWSADCPPPRSS